jgi:HPt (histidine-containing phosphotransfer) domain-containing protein
VEPIVDKDALLQRLEGDQELLDELVVLFLADCPRLLEEIRSAAARGDTSRFLRAAQTLKGSVSNFCAPAATEAAQALELLGHLGALDQVAGGIARMEELVGQVTVELDVGRRP